MSKDVKTSLNNSKKNINLKDFNASRAQTSIMKFFNVNFHVLVYQFTTCTKHLQLSQLIYTFYEINNDKNKIINTAKLTYIEDNKKYI